MARPYRAFRLQRTERAYKSELIYDGWNFNSGNYLFTTDTK